MKHFYRRSWLIFATVLTLVLACGMLTAADSDYVVKNLHVQDIPNDSGDGLRLSWQPLEKEKKVIEYRIYRGISKDSLFYIGKIAINKKTGIAAETMYYYDKGLGHFLSIHSPGKLKAEKDQPKEGPIYRAMPRDLNVTGQYLKHFGLLGVVPKEENYFHAKKIEKDGEFYAGYKVRQMNIYGAVQPGQEYFYAVIAVDSRRKYHEPSEIASCIPEYNLPEVPQEFYAVNVQDKERLQFEWSLPTEENWVYGFNVYMLDKAELDAFEQYKKYNLESSTPFHKQQSGIDVEMKELDEVENPAVKIYNHGTSYPWTSLHYGVVEHNDEAVKDLLKEKTIDDYVFVFSYNNALGGETFFPETVKANNVMSSSLPKIPAITVRDKENDKGDYNEIYWGKPVVNLTKLTYNNEEKTKLTVNYEYLQNKDNKINNIYVKVFDEKGNQIGDEINEFFLDYKLNLKIPENVNADNGLRFELTLKVNGETLENYDISQTVTFNDETLSLVPDEVMVNGIEANEYNMFIFKQSQDTKNYRRSKKVNGITREAFDNVAFEKSTFRGLTGAQKYDAEKQLLLTNHRIKIGYNMEENEGIYTSCFAELHEDVLLGTVKRFENMLKDAETEDEKAQIQERIDAARANVDETRKLYSNYENFSKYHGIKNNAKRMEAMAVHREKVKRNFKYYAMVSDGKGHFSIGEPTKERHIPIGNWFDRDKIPTLVGTLLFTVIVFVFVTQAKRGRDFYIRPIAGIQEIDNAIGRATEMGRPILFQPGLSSISDVATLAGLSILGRVAKKAAEYDTRILVPVRDFIVLPIAQEIVKEAHYEAGRPDTYDKTSVFFITQSQFAFVAGVNGVMIREKTATNFYMGMFWAESLIMTETGNSTGAIQIAGTDAATQIPFFITTCDYTLIGEELYAASAYMAREPLMMGTLKAQDITKLIIMCFILFGTILSTAHVTFLLNWFPAK